MPSLEEFRKNPEKFKLEEEMFTEVSVEIDQDKVDRVKSSLAAGLKYWGHGCQLYDRGEKDICACQLIEELEDVNDPDELLLISDAIDYIFGLWHITCQFPGEGPCTCVMSDMLRQAAGKTVDTNSHRKEKYA